MAEREDEALFDQLFRCIGNKTMNNDSMSFSRRVVKTKLISLQEKILAQ